MSTFRVRASSLGEVAAQLQSVVAVFDAHVADVSGKVSAVSGASWVGEDQEAFHEKWTHWQQTADAVRLSLTSLAGQLVAAEGAYSATESRTQTGFAQRRQANTEVVATVEEVDESVDTGLDRARTGAESVAASTTGAGMTMRTGRGQKQTAPAAVRTGGRDE